MCAHVSFLTQLCDDMSLILLRWDYDWVVVVIHYFCSLSALNAIVILIESFILLLV